MNEQQTYTVESFQTGLRKTVSASSWWAALEGEQEDSFTVIQNPDGRYSAVVIENSVLPIAGEHVADDPQTAASGVRQHYAAVKSAAA